MIASSIATRARTLLNDTAGARWSDAEICMWIADGQTELVTLKPNAYTKLAAHTLAAGSRQSFSAGDAHMILDVVRNTGGNAITVTPRETLDMVAPNWHNTTGSAVENYCFDPREPLAFWVYPGKASGSPAVDVLYSAVPPDVAALTDTLALGDIYRSALTNYVMHKALLKEDEAGSAQKAEGYYRIFVQSVTGKVSKEKGESPNLVFVPFDPSVPGAAK